MLAIVNRIKQFIFHHSMQLSKMKGRLTGPGTMKPEKRFKRAYMGDWIIEAT